MPDQNPATGLIACEECGAPRSASQIDASDAESNTRCTRCGNDSFTALRDPSGR